jgi:hypothetical protein
VLLINLTAAGPSNQATENHLTFLIDEKPKHGKVVDSIKAIRNTTKGVTIYIPDKNY